jgi:hypothetical protein
VSRREKGRGEKKTKREIGKAVEHEGARNLGRVWRLHHGLPEEHPLGASSSVREKRSGSAWGFIFSFLL